MPSKTLNPATNKPLLDEQKARRKTRNLEAASNFDSLPNSAHVRLPVVGQLFACSSATVWRLVQSGLIPAPKKLGPRITAWNVGELRDALGV